MFVMGCDKYNEDKFSTNKSFIVLSTTLLFNYYMVSYL